MPLVGFEHTIPELERTKAVHALDRAATVQRKKYITSENKKWHKVYCIYCKKEVIMYSTKNYLNQRTAHVDVNVGY
jgi:hypothetical protein